MSVYKAINSIQRELAKSGITKDRTANTGKGGSYKFRGIDDVYNALSPLLAEHGLCILPRMVAREVVERQSSSGNALFYVTVDAEFDFVCAEDGSKHTVKTFGEAMDTGDKATNKAMSAAYKYAAFQAFAIPTEADNDSENQTHEVKASINRTQAMKVRSKIQEHIAADRDLGVIEEWDFCREQGEEFCSAVWSGLTTPERDTIRRLNASRKLAA